MRKIFAIIALILLTAGSAWALNPLPDPGTPNFSKNSRAVFDEWKAAIELNNGHMTEDSFVENIQLLKAKARAGYAIVSGFYSDGDGGGNLFKWDSTRIKTAHNGGTVIDPDTTITPGATGWWTTTSTSGTGCWVAVDTDVFNIKMFGAKPDDGSDATEAINNTMLAAQDAKRSVYAPGGLYSITTIIRRNKVPFYGDGSRQTQFVALPRSSSVPYGMVELEPGRVIAAHMEGMAFYGGSTPTSITPVNPDQWGLYIHAQWDSTYTDGGLWYTNDKDIVVSAFNHGIWLRGGYTIAHGQRPNQFDTFYNVQVSVPVGGEPLLATGQNGQIAFIGGIFSGSSSGKALLAFAAKYDPDPSTTADDASGWGESTADVSGAGNAVRSARDISFLAGATIERANEAVFVQGDQVNIKFTDVWFEDIGAVFNIGYNAQVSVDHSRFANCADGTNLLVPSAGSGYMVELNSKSRIDFGDGNVSLGTIDNWYKPGSSIEDAYNLKYSTFSKGSADLFEVSTVKTVLADASGVIDVKGINYCYLNVSATELSTINSFCVPGDTLTLYAYNGAVTLNNTGNIYLPHNVSALTVEQYSVISFLRVDKYGGKEWTVVGNEAMSGGINDDEVQVRSGSGFEGFSTLTYNQTDGLTVSDDLKIGGASPFLWIDETDGAYGARYTLYSGVLSIQRVGLGYGAYEAAPFRISLDAANDSWSFETNGDLRLNIGAIRIGDTTASDDGFIKWDGADFLFRDNGVWQIKPNMVSAPALATSAGEPGQIAYDSTYFYVCVATATWVRTLLGTW